MHRSALFVTTAILAALPGAASAMSRDSVRLMPGERATITDPDARLERMAAASTPNDNGKGKPRKDVRGILKDDPYLNEAFAWLNNK